MAGDPAGSELIKRLKGTSLPRMPMNGPPYLADKDVALFERWIREGLPPRAVSDMCRAKRYAQCAIVSHRVLPVIYAHIVPGGKLSKSRLDHICSWA